jgi:DNA-binding HxlR family transcriptional regulator
VLLADGPRRFNELKRMIGGVSQRMLTLTLRGLERDGHVTRTIFPTIPPRESRIAMVLGCFLQRAILTDVLELIGYHLETDQLGGTEGR